MLKEPKLNDPEKPLVSVLIFNYNYGRYLRECFESILNQTYDNIEINFSDNASDDDSWKIAQEFAMKNPGLITITRNRINFGSDANFANCALNARGKYFIEMCSDDALNPECIERCVTALESNLEAGFAMVHRTIIDENGIETEEPPFYNQSCIIPGAEQAAVYMMAAVNPSISQIVYSKDKTYGKSVTGGLAGRWYGTRLLDFNICCHFPIIYIHEPLLLHRLHSLNDSLQSADNLLEVIVPYILHHQFAETASIFNIKKAVDRLPAANEKLSKLCLRYCIRALQEKDKKNGQRYFHLAIAIAPEIMSDPIFEEIQRYWKVSTEKKLEIITTLGETNNLISRSVSYDPPPGSIALTI